MEIRANKIVLGVSTVASIILTITGALWVYVEDQRELTTELSKMNSRMAETQQQILSFERQSKIQWQKIANTREEVAGMRGELKAISTRLISNQRP